MKPGFCFIIVLSLDLQEPEKWDLGKMFLLSLSLLLIAQKENNLIWSELIIADYLKDK